MHPIFAAKSCDPEGNYVLRWIKPELRNAFAALGPEYVHCPWQAPVRMTMGIYFRGRAAGLLAGGNGSGGMNGNGGNIGNGSGVGDRNIDVNFNFIDGHDYPQRVLIDLDKARRTHAEHVLAVRKKYKKELVSIRGNEIIWLANNFVLDDLFCESGEFYWSEWILDEWGKEDWLGDIQEEEEEVIQVKEQYKGIKNHSKGERNDKKKATGVRQGQQSGDVWESTNDHATIEMLRRPPGVSPSSIVARGMFLHKKNDVDSSVDDPSFSTHRYGVLKPNATPPVSKRPQEHRKTSSNKNSSNNTSSNAFNSDDPFLNTSMWIDRFKTPCQTLLERNYLRKTELITRQDFREDSLDFLTVQTADRPRHVKKRELKNTHEQSIMSDILAEWRRGKGAEADDVL